MDRGPWCQAYTELPHVNQRRPGAHHVDGGRGVLEQGGHGTARTKAAAEIEDRGRARVAGVYRCPGWWMVVLPLLPGFLGAGWLQRCHRQPKRNRPMTARWRERERGAQRGGGVWMLQSQRPLDHHPITTVHDNDGRLLEAQSGWRWCVPRHPGTGNMGGGATASRRRCAIGDGDAAELVGDGSRGQGMHNSAQAWDWC